MDVCCCRIRCEAHTAYQEAADEILIQTTVGEEPSDQDLRRQLVGEEELIWFGFL